MKKGYLEMAKLNLALAIEYQHIETFSLGYELAIAEG